MKPRLSYANVMSTVAMFAALTTGGAYAAVTLKANSVTSRHIKNGQVTLADLHPTVKKRLGSSTSKPGAGTGGSGVSSGWVDTALMSKGLALFPCSGSDCAPDETGSVVGFTNTVEQLYSGSGKVSFRVSGTVTNNGIDTARIRLRVHGSATYPVSPTQANLRRLCSTMTILPGQTLDVHPNTCGGPASYDPAASKFTRVRVATEGGVVPNVTSNLSIEWEQAA